MIHHWAQLATNSIKSTIVETITTSSTHAFFMICESKVEQSYGDVLYVNFG